MEVDSIFKCFTFSQAGKYHQRMNQPNGDQCMALKKNGLAVVSMCDGAGSAQEGCAAAGIVSEVIARELGENFSDLYFSDGETVRRKIAQLVDRSLKSYSSCSGADPKQLACTIMAAAVDEERRCVCIHLGDGIILGKKENQTVWRIISSPQNGMTRNTTYLTMNCDMWKHLHYCRWKDPQLKSIIMLTDGAAEYLVNLSGRNGWVVSKECDKGIMQLKTYLDKIAPQDDYSCGMIVHELEENKCAQMSSDMV